jgi:hypothetical protein
MYLCPYSFTFDCEFMPLPFYFRLCIYASTVLLSTFLLFSCLFFLSIFSDFSFILTLFPRNGFLCETPPPPGREGEGRISIFYVRVDPALDDSPPPPLLPGLPPPPAKVSSSRSQSWDNPTGPRCSWWSSRPLGPAGRKRRDRTHGYQATGWSLANWHLACQLSSVDGGANLAEAGIAAGTSWIAPLTPPLS